MQVNDSVQRDAAIELGKNALASFKEARGYLKSAAGFGIWDMIFGSFIPTMLKHRKMDMAQQALDEGCYYLKAFAEKINELQISEDIVVYKADFLSFADYLLDGILVDWAIQTRINEAKEQVEATINRLEAMLKQLGEDW